MRDCAILMNEILIRIKPFVITPGAKKQFIRECAKSGIHVSDQFTTSSLVLEENIRLLMKNVESAVIKMVIRQVLRRYT